MVIIESQSSTKLWSKSFIVLTISYLLLLLCLHMLLSPFPAYVKDKFNPGDFQVSLVTSLFALSAIVTRLAVVPVLKKVHRNVVMFAGIVIAVLATILYSYAGNITLVLLLRILFGIGFGMASTVLPTLVSQIIPKGKLGEGIGYFGLSSSLAMSVGPTIGLAVIDGIGFRSLTYMGTLSALIIIPLLSFSRSIPPQPSRTDGQANRTSASKLPRYINKKVFMPALLNTLLSLTYGALLGFLALYGKEIHLGQVGLFFMFNAITVLLVRLVSGRIFDRFGPSFVLIPSGICVFISLFLLSYVHSFLMLAVSALIYGLGFGAIQPATQAWMLRESPPESHGAVNSLFYNTVDLGVATGSMLLGVVASHTGYAVMYRWSSGIMLLFLAVYILGRVFSPAQGKPKARKLSAESVSANESSKVL